MRGQILFRLIIAYQAVSESLAKDMNILINYPVFQGSLDIAIGASLCSKEHAVFCKGKHSKGPILMNLGCLDDSKRQLIDPK